MLLFCISLQHTLIFLVANVALQSWTVLQGKLTTPAGVTQTCGWLFLLLLSTYVPSWDHSDAVHYCRICYFWPDQVLHLSISNTTSTVHLHHLFLHGQRNRGRSIDTDDTLPYLALNQTFNTITSISIQMASLVAKIKVTSRNNCQWLFCIFCPRPMMRKGTNRFNDQGWWSQRCSYYIPYTISKGCSYFYFS